MGAESSIARLIKVFLPYIHKRATSISVRGLDTDDIVQEGLIGLFHAMKRYDGKRGAEFSTFAFACINNGISGAIRQAVRKKHLPLRDYLSFDEEHSATLSNGYTPEDLAVADEAYLLLCQMIKDRLSVFEKEVLALRLEGYEYPVMAEKLSVTVKSVDNALQRVRKKLKSETKAG